MKADGDRRVLVFTLGRAAAARAFAPKFLFDRQSGGFDLSRGDPAGGFKGEFLYFRHSVHAPSCWLAVLIRRYRAPGWRTVNTTTSTPTSASPINHVRS